LIKGTGLGLAIVKEIVDALGGRIGAESAGSGQGSRFWFTLPLAVTVGRKHADVVLQLPELVQSPPSTSSVLRILVVDDDAAIRSTIRRVLRPDGHEVTLVASAEEALEQCRRQSFDVLLTDLGLGSGMDGWKLVGHIRRDWPHVHVIVASGRIGLDVADAHSRGVAALLSKPYQADDLRSVVRDVDDVPQTRCQKQPNQLHRLSREPAVERLGRSKPNWPKTRVWERCIAAPDR
jgi:CheY-like chemotaxis protein